MKTSTKIIFLLAMPLVASVGYVRGADETAPPPPPDGEHARPRMQEMREHRMKQLDEKVKLTAEQKTKIYAIWDKAEADARAARDATADKEDLRAKRRAAMQAMRQEVRAVLTPEQQTIFDTLPPDRPPGGKRGGGPGGPGGDGK